MPGKESFMSRNRYDNELAILLGNQLRELRRQRGWTQESVANRAKCPTDVYARIERGRAVPDVRVFYNLTVVFDVSADKLLGRPVKFHRPETVKRHWEPTRKHDRTAELVQWLLASDSQAVWLVLLVLELLALDDEDTDDDS